MSSPPVEPPWACANGLGRVRWFRARRLPAGLLVLAASFVFLGLPSGATAQFPIRQVPRAFGGAPTAIPANALPGQFVSNGAGQAASQQQAAQPQPPPHPAIARIVVPEKDGISYGSGTLVDARGQFGLVVTNWHVVRDAAGTVSVEFPGGFKSPAQVVKTDKDWDLAALSVYRPQATPLPVTATAPQPGEWLTIAGYGGGDWRTATGKCTQYLAPGIDFPHEMVELSTEARQGDSGGPILNSRGEVAGVLFGSGPGYTSGSYGGRVLQFLATVIPGGTPGSDAAPPAGLAHHSPTLSDGQLSGNSAYSMTPPTPPQSTALHAMKPPAPLADDVWADRTAAKPPLDMSALTPALQPTSDPLLSPPPKDEMADRFGSRPLASMADEVDPRVAVSPDRLTTATATLTPDKLAPVPLAALPNGSLPPRVGAGSGAAVDLNQAPPDQLLAAAWKKLGGVTVFDQTKSVLAIVGLLAVAVVLWRMGGQKEVETYEE